MWTCTEVASEKHVLECIKYGVDMVWIGARTSANPFLMQEIADALEGTDMPVLVKNPVNPDLDLWVGALERLNRAGIRKLGVIHRGFSTSAPILYRNDPGWRIAIQLRTRYPQMAFFADPSHMAGRADLVPHLAQMALDMKAEGLFIEVHPNPEQALSDKAQQLTPAQFMELESRLILHREPLQADLEYMEPLRARLEETDLKLIQDLAERFRITGSIGEYKNLHNLAILQPDRYNAISDILTGRGQELGLDDSFIRLLFETIHAESIRCQIENNKKQNK